MKFALLIVVAVLTLAAHASYAAAEAPRHSRDILPIVSEHCFIRLGVDHTKLTYRHQGRKYRLSDVGGEVKQQLLAWV